MKNYLRFSLLIAFAFTLLTSCNKRSGNAKILVFTRTAGYHHASIAAGSAAIMKLGQENDFGVDTSSNAAKFTDDTLKKYAAVVFLNTTDTADVLLNNYEENANRDYFIFRVPFFYIMQWK